MGGKSSIFSTSIFSFKGLRRVLNGPFRPDEPFSVHRGNNPTVNILEEKLAALEHAERQKLFGSGVAAIVSSISAFLKSGDHIVTVRTATAGHPPM